MLFHGSEPPSSPGLDVELALRRVRDEVLQATKNRQEPFKYGSLGGGEIGLVAVNTNETTKQVEVLKQHGEAAEAWTAVKDSTNVIMLESYIARYKKTIYADFALARLAGLKKQATTSTVANKSFDGTWRLRPSATRGVIRRRGKVPSLSMVAG